MKVGDLVEYDNPVDAGYVGLVVETFPEWPNGPVIMILWACGKETYTPPTMLKLCEEVKNESR